MREISNLIQSERRDLLQRAREASQRILCRSDHQGSINDLLTASSSQL
jgi:hypothetical protein